MIKKAWMRGGAPRGVRGLAGSAKGIITMGIMVCLAISVAEAQEIYKWVDEKGVTHYSDTPPPDRQSKDIDTVKGDKVVSPVRTTTIQSDKIEPSATGQTTTQQPAQVDVWVDEYGNRHPITEELIAQETARLQEKLRYYEHDCINNYKGPNSGNGAFDLRAKDEHKRWCDTCAENVKRDLESLASSPGTYFYNKNLREKQRPQREVEQAEQKTRDAEQRARDAENRARNAEQKARDAEEGIP
jgi:hypothetical protein